jgi:uncharacterized membrane protein
VATVIPPPCPCIAATVRNESRVTVAALRARMVSPSRGIDIHKAADHERRVEVESSHSFAVMARRALCGQLRTVAVPNYLLHSGRSILVAQLAQPDAYTTQWLSRVQ